MKGEMGNGELGCEAEVNFHGWKVLSCREAWKVSGEYFKENFGFHDIWGKLSMLTKTLGINLFMLGNFMRVCTL